jgi:hypothetical protein
LDRGSKRLALIVGTVAAAAGVAVATYFFLRRHDDDPPLRSVSDVLTDAYSKMREIQTHLTELHPPEFQPSKAS